MKSRAIYFLVQLLLLIVALTGNQNHAHANQNVAQGYLSQDPIGLAGGMPNMYAYVHDSNSFIDPLGLEKCQLSSADKKKVMKMFSDEGLENPHFHHIVREKAPKKWPKKYKDYITESQKMIKEAGIGLNDDIRNFTRAENGKGAHTQKAAQHVYEQLAKSDNIEKTLSRLAKEMNAGKFF